MKWLTGAVVCVLMFFGPTLYVEHTNYNDQKIACIHADGRGKLLTNSLGIPSGYECRRMHLLMKYRNGRYQ